MDGTMASYASNSIFLRNYTSKHLLLYLIKKDENTVKLKLLVLYAE